MIGFILLYVVVYIIAELLFRNVAPFLPEEYGSQLFYLGIEIIVLTVLFTLTKARKIKIREQVKAKAISPKIMVISLIIGIATAIFTSSFLIIVESPQLQIPFNATSIILFLFFHLENSIYKEVYYRGYVFNEMQGKMHIAGAIFIEGLIYGLLFMGPNLPAIAYGYLGVILFTMVYVWTGSLWSGVIVQFSSTVGIFLLSSTELNIINGQNVMTMLMMGSMMLMGSLIWLRLSGKKHAPLKEKAEKTWRTMGWVGLTMTVLTICSIIIFFVHDWSWNNVGGYAEFIQSNNNILIVIYCTIAVGVMALIFKKRKGSVAAEWHIKKMTRRNTLLISCIGVCIALFTTSLTSIGMIGELFPSFNVYMDAFMSDMPSLPLQILCILAIPFLEEIIFRGIIFYQLRRETSLVLATVVSVSIYAVMQGNVLIGVYSILGSVIYTLCFEFGGSLWGAVLVQEVSAILMMIIRRTALLNWFGSFADTLLIMLCVASASGMVYAFRLLCKGDQKPVKSAPAEMVSVK